jgi:hypothetical protein
MFTSSAAAAFSAKISAETTMKNVAEPAVETMTEAAVETVDEPMVKMLKPLRYYDRRPELSGGQDTGTVLEIRALPSGGLRG